ncbi:transglutaminase family protein [Yimella sp. cx-51]|uniref:transglutaminase family protein n=1 Tax=Yimella sp. cx-51 TaxID=2770551 RepID=UPI00165E7143|nr:transglutaminase family protein [Yimella sp. cx-51]MBC9956346.1 transglutaminase family protein [Yimella sp. cx-51]QTH38528.1 transglutaminase family protein [Yimella sp. cx-51]
MSVTLRLVHRAGYTYSGPSIASYNEARMIPKSTAAQTVSHTRMEITPTPWQDSWTDYWGTNVTTFEIHEPHDELKVVSISTVTVHRTPRAPGDLDWTVLAQPELTDQFGEYLELAGATHSGTDLTRAAAQLRDGCESPSAYVDAVLELLHQRQPYASDRAAHLPSADVAWEQRSGNAIDLAHVTLAMLRTAGIPARFVAGYRLSETDAEVGDVITGFGHAWVEWWDGSWCAVDPALRCAPDDFYIEVAHGRDYSDVVPLRGIFTGTPGSKMFVTVEISRLA